MNNLKQRKPNRLKGYDYSQNGAYFITICTQGRQEILGQIVGDGVLDIPQMQLTAYGETANKHILAIAATYKNIAIDNYVIMPNHIHFILMVIHAKDGMSGTPSPTNALVPSVVSTFKRFTHKDCGYPVFQRSYHDHIIRNEKEYLKIWQYIDTNPSTWLNDCFYESHR